ncbi:MAG: amino acid-binding protein, partial [Candidatus Syntropharchaeia archaeon]
MKVSMDIELKDIPGQLVSALRPISDFGGNISSVIHHREKMTPRQTIPVQVVFDIDEGKLSPLVEELKRKGITIVRIGKERLKDRISVILIGHIIHSDVREIIDVIDKTGFAEVVELSISMPEIDKKSSAFLTINALGEEEMKKAIKLLQEK